MGVIGGVERMKEINQARPTHKMKGLRTAMPLRGALLVGEGQRKLTAEVAGQLVGHQFQGYSDALRKKAVAEALCTNKQKEARDKFAKHSLAVVRAVGLESIGAVSANHASADCADELLRDIAAYFGDSLSAPSVAAADDDEPIELEPQRTLDSLVRDWRIVECERELGHMFSVSVWDNEQRALMRERACGKMLLVDVRRRARELTSGALLAESVWRALLPIFGTDVLYRVLASSGTEQLAICALECDTAYAEKIYELVRVERWQTFVDLLHEGDCNQLLAPLARAVDSDAIFVSNIDGQGEAERQRELMGRRAAALKQTRTRAVYPNFVTTAIADITLSFALQYEPFELDPDGGAPQIRFARGALPNESERTALEIYYSEGAFTDWGVNCGKPECNELRQQLDDDDNALAGDPDARYRHESAQRGCLSDWVLVLRLSREWFERNKRRPAEVRAALERVLPSKVYHVFLGDENSSGYIPLRIRLFECMLPAAYANVTLARFRENEQFPLTSERKATEAGAAWVVPESRSQWEVGDDFVRTVLDRTRHLVLPHVIAGPSSGTRVMCEETRTQIYTPERGIEHILRPTLVCDSAELHHLLGLRGIDSTRAVCNSVLAMEATFGIESARFVARREYQRVLADSGSFVDPAYFALRVDLQTRDGRFLPITHSGLGKGTCDPWQLISHREAARLSTEAALRHKTAAVIASPSAATITGQQAQHLGTNALAIFMDLDKLTSADVVPMMEPGDVLHCAQSAQVDQMAEMLGSIDDYRLDRERPMSPTHTNLLASPTHDWSERLQPDDNYDPSVAFSPVHETQYDSIESESAEEPETFAARTKRLIREAKVQDKLGQLGANEPAEMPNERAASEAVRQAPIESLRNLVNLVGRTRETEYEPVPIAYSPTEVPLNNLDEEDAFVPESRTASLRFF